VNVTRWVGEPAVRYVTRGVSIDHHMRSPPDIASLTPGAG